MRKPNYDKFPTVAAQDPTCWAGWPAICAEIQNRCETVAKAIIVVETYPGVLDDELLGAFTNGLKPAVTILARDAYLPAEQIDQLVAPDLGGDDPVFGRLSLLNMQDFFDPTKRAEATRRIAAESGGTILIYGSGASLLCPQDNPCIFIYADMARWEIQMRQRAGTVSNLGVENPGLRASLKYKRAFFIDWRVADRLKRQTFDRWDYLLDTNIAGKPKMIPADTMRQALRDAVRRPFRVVPFFDPGPWGGQWMKEICSLDHSAKNYAWCFDCVPEENSLLLAVGDQRIEIPSIDMVFLHPEELLGPAVYGRFGAEFPIRFDFLDTIHGGNLSLQVHPLTGYIQQAFGMHYTQDESYYMLDAGEGASVYLGLKDNIQPAELLAQLKRAQAGGPAPEVEKFVNRWPAKKHDHFLIPAGTIHCSGAEAMVLEISATPYIFTFKLWDWGRMGLDGRPRPVHINHGAPNLQWQRTTGWVKENLINAIEPLGHGDGWREERTGLHEAEFIETRRHWFTAPVEHDTHGGVNVLNLVEGEEAVVESPTGAFAPFVVHYAETFIVPAAVGRYVIRPYGAAMGKQCATMKAFVRKKP